MTNSLGGILPALVTPLTPEETLNTKALEQLLERVFTAGVDGVYLCGSTGEGQSQPEAIRREVTEVAMRNIPPGKQVIVHVGAASFAQASSLARHAEACGAAAVSSLRPAGASFSELMAYYKDLAAATALPFLAYYFPSAGEQLSFGQLTELCAIPGIVGLKFTDYDLFTLQSLTRAGAVMFNGRDEILAGGLLLGAHGGIGSIYNLVPSLFVEIATHAKAGRWAEAVTVQTRVNELIRILIRFPFIAALKQYLRWDGIETGPVLRPRTELSPTEIAELRAALLPLELIPSL